MYTLADPRPMRIKQLTVCWLEWTIKQQAWEGTLLKNTLDFGVAYAYLWIIWHSHSIVCGGHKRVFCLGGGRLYAVCSANGWVAWELTNKGKHALNGNMQRQTHTGTIPPLRVLDGARTIPTGMFKGLADDAHAAVNELKATDGAFMPKLKHQLGLQLTPTQVYAYVRSANIGNTWAADMYPADRIVNVDFTPTTRSGRVLRNTTGELTMKGQHAQQVNIPCSQHVWAGTYRRRRARIITGHAHRSGQFIDEVLAKVLMDITSKHHASDIGTILSAYRRVGPQQRQAPRDQYNDTVNINHQCQLLWATHPGFSYARFYECAFRDLIQMSIIQADGVANWNFHGAGAGNAPAAPNFRVCDVGPMRLLPVAPGALPLRAGGAEDEIWGHLDDFSQGTRFLFDMGGLTHGELGILSRYAATWPPEEITRVDANRRITVALVAHTTIPGASTIVAHYGQIVDVADADIGMTLGYIAPETIIATLLHFINKTNTGADARLGYERAVAAAFGRSSNVWRDIPTGVNKNLRKSTIDALHSQDWSCYRDSTLLEYFRPWLIQGVTDDVVNLLTLQPAAILEHARLMNHSIAIAYEVALAAASVTGSVGANINTNNQLGNHARWVFRRNRPTSMSWVDLIAQMHAHTSISGHRLNT